MEGDIEDKIKIRAELANMSFGELKKLKERLGAKVYNEAVFGVESNKRKFNKKETFKRENKNRPREMSSKKPVPLVVKKPEVVQEENAPRDPRFDSLCGTYNPKGFNRSYSFLKDVRTEELKELKRELKDTEDEERRDQIKYLIQRIENKNREQMRNEERLYKQKMEHLEHINLMKKGKQPSYVKKSDKKVIDLVEKYEELKKSGKIEKHISKHRKRNTQKAKKDIDFL